MLNHARHFTHFLAFNSNNDPMRERVIFCFTRWKKLGLQGAHNNSLSGQDGTWTQVCLTPTSETWSTVIFCSLRQPVNIVDVETRHGGVGLGSHIATWSFQLSVSGFAAWILHHWFWGGHSAPREAPGPSWGWSVEKRQDLGPSSASPPSLG